jgi:hypothetical protein
LKRRGVADGEREYHRQRVFTRDEIRLTTLSTCAG